RWERARQVPEDVSRLTVVARAGERDQAGHLGRDEKEEDDGGDARDRRGAQDPSASQGGERDRPDDECAADPRETWIAVDVNASRCEECGRDADDRDMPPDRAVREI